MGAGELFLSDLLQVVLVSLASGELLDFAIHGSIQEKLNKWRKMLTTIQDVLTDAEQKQLTNGAVKIWLSELRDLLYDVEDILDEAATEFLRCKIMAERQASSNVVHDQVPCLNAIAVQFSVSAGSRINSITTRLEQISNRRSKLGLEKIIGEMHSNAQKKHLNSCFPTEFSVHGRDNDKKKILELLLRESSSGCKFSVIPIVGIDGVGKTTLARLIYHDEASKDFDLKIWVHASDNDFDVAREALLNINNCSWDSEEIETLLRLREDLSQKRLLVVLDNVQSKNIAGQWEGLKFALTAGAAGSKVIVTTPDRNVAVIMEAAEYVKLNPLTDDDCWSVFVDHALPNRDFDTSQNLKLIREKVIHKCKGSPLAARILGGILYCEERSNWQNVLNDKIWSFSNEEDDIIPVLRLSYHYLPSHLKRCFAYCSILNNYEFEEMELILLWMAEGLIPHGEENQQIKDLGHEYFQELRCRSLFQQSSGDVSRFFMQDMINNLAQWAAGDVCFRLQSKVNDEQQPKGSKSARHSSYFRGNYDNHKRIEEYFSVESLRTFLPLQRNPKLDHQSYLTTKALDLLPKLRCLRVLCLSGYYISHLRESIGDLKHLRYLNLSYTRIRFLPESTSNLCNLQTLKLKGCFYLKKWPANMHNLVNLRYLDVTNVDSVEGMPVGMKELKNLCMLPEFIVGKNVGSGIGDLKKLKLLQESFKISRLENVFDSREASNAELKDLNLKTLSLKWSSKFDNSRDEIVEFDVIEKLQPCTKLKQLSIEYYGGTKFPKWLGDTTSLSHLVQLELDNCERCISLPPLGQLPSLKDLCIRRLFAVESLGPEFLGEAVLEPFPALETLEFEDMREWKDWRFSSDVANTEFPCLRRLTIKYCPKLSGKLPNYLPSLEKLEIYQCEQLVVSIPSLPMLNELEIVGCKEVVQTSIVEFRTLDLLELSCISKLTCLTEGEGFMQGLTKVEKLQIRGLEDILSLGSLDFVRYLETSSCSPFISLGSEGGAKKEPQLQIPSSVECLTLLWCERFVKFQIEFTTLVRLRELYITGNRGCVLFRESILPPSLKKLEIKDCFDLQCVLDVEENVNVRNTCLLEVLTITQCPFLTCLSARGELPGTLQYLKIYMCSSLEMVTSQGNLPSALKHLDIACCSVFKSIAKRFQKGSSLEYISIWDCSELQSLPECLYNLNNLKVFYISLRNFVSFPEGGFPTTNLRLLMFLGCDKLEALPNNFPMLSSLQRLFIDCCPSNLQQQGLPPNLTSLSIRGPEICKALFEWGLHKLASLKELTVSRCQDVESFPVEEMGMKLPGSLTCLDIEEFPNLRYLSSRGFRNLNSLATLRISDCPKLTSLPKDGLPPSLLHLSITRCPLLEEHCKTNKGLERFKIAHIPCVDIGYRYIHDREK